MVLGFRPQAPKHQRACLAQGWACSALPSWCLNVCLHITVISVGSTGTPWACSLGCQKLFLAPVATFSFPTTGLGIWWWEITVMALFTAQLLTLSFTTCKVGDHYNPFLPWEHKESINKSQKGVLWDLWIENIPGLLLLLVMAHTYSTSRYFKLH